MKLDYLTVSKFFLTTSLVGLLLSVGYYHFDKKDAAQAMLFSSGFFSVLTLCVVGFGKLTEFNDE